MTQRTARILLVDDEPDIRLILRDYLLHAGYEVELAADGREALRLFDGTAPDLVLLDRMLPSVTGEDVLRHIRRRGATPVILLTAKTAEDDRVGGLEMGADDYVPKPFSPREVVARVGCVLRRSAAFAGVPGPRATIAAGDLVLDPDTASASRGGRDLGLTVSEYRILEALVRARGRTLGREAIIEAAFPGGFDGCERTMDSHIRNLRRKVEDDPARPALILTVRGLGYRFRSGK